MKRFVFICALFVGLFPVIAQAQESPLPDENSRDNVTVQDSTDVVGNDADVEARDGDLVTLDGIQRALRRGTTWYSQHSWLGRHLQESPVLNSLKGVYPDRYDRFAFEVLALANILWLLYAVACVIYPCKPFRRRKEATLFLIAAFFSISLLLPSIFFISLPLSYERDGGFILALIITTGILSVFYSAIRKIYPTFKPFTRPRDTALFIAAILFIIFIVSPPFILWFRIVIYQPPDYERVSDGGLILALVVIAGVLRLLYPTICKIYPSFKPFGRLKDTMLSLAITFFVILIVLPSVLFWYDLVP